MANQVSRFTGSSLFCLLSAIETSPAVFQQLKVLKEGGF
jgi:hypothetical protein